MVTNKVQGAWMKPLQGKEQSSSKQANEGLWRSFCQKPRHTRDTCFKLHGKEAVVLSKLGGFRKLQPKNQGRAYPSTKETKEKIGKANSTASIDLGELNAEEIRKLKYFLKTLQGECSLTQAGMCLNSKLSLASYIARDEL